MYAKRLWNYHRLRQAVKPADALFVPCSTDLSTGERAIELYKQGYGQYLIFSGGRGRLSQHLYNKPEAELYADMARRAGIPETKIIIENQAANTGENILFTHALLTKKGLKPRSILVVQKPYMERRLLATLLRQWPDAHTEFTITSPEVTYEAYTAHIAKDHVINMLVGDTQRIAEYPKQGFMVKQDIPDAVRKAYEKLVAAGYTKQLIKR